MESYCRLGEAVTSASLARLEGFDAGVPEHLDGVADPAVKWAIGVEGPTIVRQRRIGAVSTERLGVQLQKSSG